MTVPRYDLSSCYSSPVMEKDPEGEYVRWEEYEVLRLALERMLLIRGADRLTGEAFRIARKTLGLTHEDVDTLRASAGKSDASR